MEASVYASVSFTSFVIGSLVYVAVWSTAATVIVIAAGVTLSSPST